MKSGKLYYSIFAALLSRKTGKSAIILSVFSRDSPPADKIKRGCRGHPLFGYYFCADSALMYLSIRAWMFLLVVSICDA